MLAHVLLSMTGTRLVAICLAGAALVGVPAATAKDFGPGDLSVCNHDRCVPIVKRSILPLLGDFYYGGKSPPTAARPRLGPLRLTRHALARSR